VSPSRLRRCNPNAVCVPLRLWCSRAYARSRRNLLSVLNIGAQKNDSSRTIPPCAAVFPHPRIASLCLIRWQLVAPLLSSDTVIEIPPSVNLAGRTFGNFSVSRLSPVTPGLAGCRAFPLPSKIRSFAPGPAEGVVLPLHSLCHPAYYASRLKCLDRMARFITPFQS
jgi:hypothetical protein